MTHNQFTHALLRTPAQTVTSGLTTRELGAPDIHLTLEQYNAYRRALTTCGLDVSVLPPDSRYPDGHFVEDTAVIYRDLAVITQPGAVARRQESASIAANLPQKQQVKLNGESYLDGGDVLFCADRVLIGLSTRTNQAGANALKTALQTVDTSLKVDFVPIDGVLHLKTGITELAPGVLLRSPALQTDFTFDFAEVITLPADQEYAANVLPINDILLIPAGHPHIGEIAQQHYTKIIELDMSEFKKMDGSLTCLSLRYWL